MSRLESIVGKAFAGGALALTTAATFSLGYLALSNGHAALTAIKEGESGLPYALFALGAVYVAENAARQIPDIARTLTGRKSAGGYGR